MRSTRRWSAIFFAVCVATLMAPGGQLAFAAGGSEAANLDQCANGNPISPTACDTNNATDWVNGNLGMSKATYFEGDSIPYRMRFTNLTGGASSVHTVTIQWDTTQSGKHALDYLTSYNRTVTTADPCAGITGCGSATTFPIPPDPNVTGAGVTPIGGQVFTLENGTIDTVSAYTLTGTYAGSSSTSITISFTASGTGGTSATLAWGGHISTRTDWGLTNSAVAISGSPYHTRLLDIDGGGGNQDRSLSADAVTFPGTITIIKDAVPNSAQSFSYSTTSSVSPALSPATFSLTDPTGATPGCGVSNTECYTNLRTFPATYTVTEAPVSGWTLSFGTSVCTVTSPNGGTQTASGNTITINQKEGENVTCVFTNSRDTGQLTVDKVLSPTTDPGKFDRYWAQRRQRRDHGCPDRDNWKPHGR
jgi:hypothetical protein